MTDDWDEYAEWQADIPADFEGEKAITVHLGDVSETGSTVKGEVES